MSRMAKIAHLAQKAVIALAALAWFVTPVLANMAPPPGSMTYQVRNSKASLGFIRTWNPFSETFNSAQAATQWQKGTSGFIGTFELEDDFDAVQILIGSNSASAGWTWTAGTVTSTAAYGPSGSPGVTPYNPLGGNLGSALPITFLNAGANSQPYPGSFYAAGLGDKEYVTTLSAQTNSGAAGLAFNSTTLDAYRFGGFTLQNGMFVTDISSGCIPNNTTISGVTATAANMSANATCNLLSGQTLVFSWVPINAAAMTIAVPASTNPGAVQFVHSDWIPISSMPRADGPLVAGMAAASACLNAGSVVQSVQPASITLNQAVASNCPTAVAISLTETPTTAAAVNSNAYFIPLSSMLGINAGQTVTGTGVPASTYVTGVMPTGVMLNNGTSQALAAGAALTFTSTVYPQAATASGNVIPLISTNGKRLLTIRAFITAAGATVGGFINSGGDNTAHQALGLPFSVTYFGGATDGIDNQNNWANTGGVAVLTRTPIFAIKYLGRHRGATVLSCGDSLTAGDSTAAQSATWVYRATAALSTPTFPVSYANRGIGGTSSLIWMPACNDMITSMQPEVVSLQGYSSDFSNGYIEPVNTYQSKLEAICQRVHAYGGVCAIHTRLPQQTIHVGQIYSGAATNASTTLPLSVYFAQASQSGGAAIEGPGIPPGTTATWNNGQNFVTLSQAATVPQGSLLQLLDVINSANTSATTAITFTTKWWGPSGVYAASGPGITGTANITMTFGSAVGAFQVAQTIPINSQLAMTSSYSQQVGAALSLAYDRQVQVAQTFAVFDAFAPLEDPANPFNYAVGACTDGVHPNDYGESLLVPGYEAFLAGLLQ